MSVAVISIDGKPLMPTGNGKARHLLKDGKAKAQIIDVKTN